jgi:uncharacterized protein (DUF2235 family)
VGYKPRGFEVPAASSVASPDSTINAAVATPTARKIVIFFDGTANDEGSDTNVKRLHSLITLQDRGDIASLYVLGVGTNLDPLGAITGSGINARVKLAYEFILNHYQRKTEKTQADEIYIFGFSRGSFGARILVTMLNFAGIVEEKPEANQLRKFTSTELADVVHELTFPGFGQGDADRTAHRSEKLAADLRGRGLRSVGENGDIAVPVKALGIWDSVEALGPPPVMENLKIQFLSAPPVVNLDEPNRRYGEKLCNVERAFHAMSIDDNRATIFTPLLLSRVHMFEGCPKGKGMLDDDRNIKAEALQEVWFSGAHSDVGGGYANGALSGVSLNWMLNRLRCTGLLPWNDCQMVSEKDFVDVKYVRDDFLGGSHDPTAGIWSFYPNVSRDLVALSLDSTSVWKQESAPICVHPSVLKRRSFIKPQPNEYTQLSVEQEGPVQLAFEAYGEEHSSWKWWRERKDSQAQVFEKTVNIQKFPKCHFNLGVANWDVAKVEGSK